MERYYFSNGALLFQEWRVIVLGMESYSFGNGELLC
jgi:hypothetical protein